MKEYELKKLINNKEYLYDKLKEFKDKNQVRKQSIDDEEIKGHLLKSEHNLRFVANNKPQFSDWSIIGCYYACYHAALALIQHKGYTSKNHHATICLLIRDFYNKELDEEDIETFNQLLDYQDLLFYVESKNKRENASYTTKTKFTKEEVEKLRIKAALFVSKIKDYFRQKE